MTAAALAAKFATARARNTELSALALVSPPVPNTPPRASASVRNERARRYQETANKEWLRAVVALLSTFGGAL